MDLNVEFGGLRVFDEFKLVFLFNIYNFFILRGRLLDEGCIDIDTVIGLVCSIIKLMIFIKFFLFAQLD